MWSFLFIFLGDATIDSSDEKFTIFNQWLVENGTKFPTLEMRVLWLKKEEEEEKEWIIKYSWVYVCYMNDMYDRNTHLRYEEYMQRPTLVLKKSFLKFRSSALSL